MPEKILQTLSGVPETLLMTLYVRARESRRPDAMIQDGRAAVMVNRIECDFSGCGCTDMMRSQSSCA